ncbi:hypothetical protein OOK60_00620 [Trichothermofontia sichuanensis B231]|uniref:hypothetical protein n=1 Tax=Trichothermofontia sichuanensis TaxID=3045816 RepID=UPI0022462670|nr:hypothetical protein [Trichothermofontia sichuanensis]UZQ54614.1 hypothetical protein OOK60_00620 [Trichothermofontia sichuanensis B231]
MLEVASSDSRLWVQVNQLWPDNRIPWDEQARSPAPCLDECRVNDDGRSCHNRGKLMSQGPTAVTAVVKSLNQAEQLFGLSRTTDWRFFPEWQSPNVGLTPGEEAALDRIKTSYSLYLIDSVHS